MASTFGDTEADREEKEEAQRAHDKARAFSPDTWVREALVDATNLPWKVFSLNGVLEIQSAETERAIIHWSGFDASAFDDRVNKANANLICEAVNALAALPPDAGDQK